MLEDFHPYLLLNILKIFSPVRVFTSPNTDVNVFTVNVVRTCLAELDRYVLGTKPFRLRTTKRFGRDTGQRRP